MKRTIWVERGGEDGLVADGYWRKRSIPLPPGLPVQGWKREGKVVTLSTEQIPGGTPVWIWSE
jgi:hypothetical protein